MPNTEFIRISIVRPDGGVSLMCFVTKSFTPEGLVHFEIEPTPENINNEISRSGIEFLSWKIVNEIDIPKDRTFRGAWKDDGSITVDMPKAREIWKDRLRRDRAPLLAELDVEFMRASESGDEAKKADVIARKKILRDVTDSPKISEAKTPEALKAIAL